MAQSLREKVAAALVEATGEDAHVELEDVPDEMIGGLVLWHSFAPLSPSERQDRIWKSLDERLTPFERTRVVFIVTDTPEEYATLKKAAG
jgi:hypothetical protein